MPILMASAANVFLLLLSSPEKSTPSLLTLAHIKVVGTVHNTTSTHVRVSVKPSI